MARDFFKGVTINTDIAIGTDATIGNDLDITNDLSVGNDLDITNNAVIQQDLEVQNDLTVGNDAEISNDLDVLNDLTVSNDLSVSNVVTVEAGTAPGGAPTDATKLWVEDINGTANKAGLHMMAESGTGKLIVTGTVIKGTTGDSAQVHEGLLQINTFDDTVKIYAESAWRQLATWAPVTTGNVIVQVVSTQRSDVVATAAVIPNDTTIPQQTEGDQFFTLAITPNNALNTLKIDAVLHFTINLACTAVVALFQDAGANAISAVMASPGDANYHHTAILSYFMTAGAIVPTTFKIRGGPTLPSVLTLNSGALGASMFVSSLTITEIEA